MENKPFTYQMNFLRAIIDGVHSEFSTQEVIHKYQLGSSANVSIVKRALVKKRTYRNRKTPGGHSRPGDESVAEKGIGNVMSPICRILDKIFRWYNELKYDKMN